ncbi:MAG: phosphate ABC transporter permease subunit PstC [Halodesulfurarchaeum sp.]
MSESLLTNAYRSAIGENPEGGASVLATVTAASLAAALVCFIVVPEYAVYPVLVFVATTAVGWVKYQSTFARLLTLVATAATVITLGLITVYLFISAVPAIREHGIDLLLPDAMGFWNPNAGLYSLLPAIWATVIVTLIAGAIAGPFGVLGALFIAQIAPDRVRAAVKPGIEILAGIPSIVYGYIGFRVLNNFVQSTFLDNGASFLIAGIVVGVMALPTVVSVAEDALSSVPESMQAGSLAMGATRWQTMKSISIPAAFSGVSAAVILGLGRAIGETMAVAAIMAAGLGLPSPLWDVFDASATLTSLIATQYGTASEMTVSVLFAAGILLFGIVTGLSVASQYIEQRMYERLGGGQ